MNGNHVSNDGSKGFETTVPAVNGLTTPLTILTVAPDGIVENETKNVKNTQTYEYDANGNLVKDSENTYTWDAADRLIRVNILNSVPTTVADTVEFKYNGLGQRTEIIEKHGDTVLTDKTLLWVDGVIGEERNTTGTTVTKRYFDQGFQIANGDSLGKYYYSKDHLGSFREVTNAAGAVVAKYDYDLWGRQTKLGGAIDADFGFTGFYVSRLTGLGLTWYRSYSSDMGRWLSREPLQETQGANLYLYVKNGPINKTDPLGLFCYYGNWGGPNWTGGKCKPYDSGDEGHYLAPIDAQDECYRQHDICYSRCRKSNCKSSDCLGQVQCKMNCDAALAKCLFNLRGRAANWHSFGAMIWFAGFNVSGCD